MESEDLINEQAWLIARGVRPLALLGTCGLDENVNGQPIQSC